MKIKNGWIIIILFIFQTNSFAEGVSFNIQLDKDTYYPKEPIYVKWSVVNDGDEVLRFLELGPTYGNMEYMLFVENGSIIEQSGQVLTDYGCLEMWHGAIPVGDSLTNDYNAEDQNLIYKYKNLKEGKYSFKAVIQKNALIGQPQIISNVVNFVIVKPEDPQGSGYDDYINIMTSGLKSKELACAFESFIAKYSKSVYTQEIILRLIAKYRTTLNDKANSEKWEEILFDQYSDSPWTASYLAELLSYYENNADSKERKRLNTIINKVIDKYPASKTGVLAKAAMERKKRTGKFTGFGAWPWVPVPLNERIKGVKYREK